MHKCKICSGTLEYLGTLGKLNWFRCRNCGMEFSCESIHCSECGNELSNSDYGYYCGNQECSLFDIDIVMAMDYI